MHPHTPRAPLTSLWFLLKWALLATAVAVLAGSASALFLWALDEATAARLRHPGLLWALPLAGFVVGWLYLRWGQSVEAGNNLLIDEIHDPRQAVPLRMAPFILGATVVSHVFGASVGREGTAVQMGGSLADPIAHRLRLPRDERRLLLMAGLAGGFASVFGTPMAGAVFALEVLAIGRLRLEALWPCLVAAVLADQVGLWWGVHHSHYSVGSPPTLTAWTLGATVLAGLAFGLVGQGFARATHALASAFRRWVAYAPLRPALGGSVIVLLAWALGPAADRYLGLGLPTIAQAFEGPLPAYDWLGKLVFTVASLGAGFKGGEVTPLFYIGATFGNALAPWLHLPVPMLAALGFVAVFAGAANTPLACTLMALELFGSGLGPFAALACTASYLVSGHQGIYRAQRVGTGKHGWHRD